MTMEDCLIAKLRKICFGCAGILAFLAFATLINGDIAAPDAYYGCCEDFVPSTCEHNDGVCGPEPPGCESAGELCSTTWRDYNASINDCRDAEEPGEGDECKNERSDECYQDRYCKCKAPLFSAKKCSGKSSSPKGDPYNLTIKDCI